MKAAGSATNNRIIFILSLVGVAIAAYVTQSFIRETGIYCINSGGCEAVRKAPESYLFGFFPVPAIGLIGYTVLAVCSFLNTTRLSKKASRLVSTVMVGMSSFGVLFVAWFTYTEIFVINGICTWCTISALNMCIIWSLIVKRYLQSNPYTV